MVLLKGFPTFVWPSCLGTLLRWPDPTTEAFLFCINDKNSENLFSNSVFEESRPIEATKTSLNATSVLYSPRTGNIIPEEKKQIGGLSVMKNLNDGLCYLEGKAIWKISTKSPFSICPPGFLSLIFEK